MGLFSRSSPAQPARPASRTIPILEPDFYESIHSRLVANGGSDTSTEIAYGIGNAVFNTGLKFLTAVDDRRAVRDFEALYDGRSPEDRTAADRMIDFLVAYNPTVQDGEGGFLSTLLSRLDDVLTRPAD